MPRFLLACVLAATGLAKEPLYDLVGRIQPEADARVSIYGATTPFSKATQSDHSGRFRFRSLLAGSYTLAIAVPGRGEARLTVDVGPANADAKGRVEVTFNLRDSDFSFRDVARARSAISVRQLAIPERAWTEYEAAQKDLARRDADAAVAHLERAVALGPQFQAAWNTLGTIAYQTRKYPRAEQCFRQALAQDPDAYEPLVNLGGVLLNLEKPAEARLYNERAVSQRPNDALANSQLGMSLFELGKFDSAEKYLNRAIEIDPAHFSHPQLTLAEIHLRQGRPKQASDDLENFLAHHPDWPKSMEVRAAIARLREEK